MERPAFFDKTCFEKASSFKTGWQIIAIEAVDCVYEASHNQDLWSVPWGAPVFVQITDDNTPFSCTYYSLLVR